MLEEQTKARFRRRQVAQRLAQGQLLVLEQDDDRGHGDQDVEQEVRVRDGVAELGQGAEVFLAEVASYGAADRSEGISEVLTVAEEELEAMAAREEITDLFTLAAWTRYRLAGF